jgi:hypothetical protein
VKISTTRFGGFLGEPTYENRNTNMKAYVFADSKTGLAFILRQSKTRTIISTEGFPEYFGEGFAQTLMNVFGDNAPSDFDLGDTFSLITDQELWWSLAEDALDDFDPHQHRFHTFTLVSIS